MEKRFRYDAFGRVHGLTSDWNRTFTGQVLDAETGLMLYRMRFYHTGLGRFVSRDPIGYQAEDMNVFRYVENNAPNDSDNSGLAPKKNKRRFLLPDISSIPILGNPWAEGDKRQRSGSKHYSSHHCYVACRYDLMHGGVPGLSAAVGNLREIAKGCEDDWVCDILNNNRGSGCALAIKLTISPAIWCAKASDLCDACCGTHK